MRTTTGFGMAASVDLDTVLIIGRIDKIGTVKITDEEIRLSGWEIKQSSEVGDDVEPVKAYTVKNLLDIHKEKKAQDILDLCPEDEKELIKQDLQKYLE